MGCRFAFAEGIRLLCLIAPGANQRALRGKHQRTARSKPKCTSWLKRRPASLVADGFSMFFRRGNPTASFDSPEANQRALRGKYQRVSRCKPKCTSWRKRLLCWWRVGFRFSFAEGIRESRSKSSSFGTPALFESPRRKSHSPA